MADDDGVIIPMWKRNFAGTKAKGDATKRMLKSIDDAMYNALDTIGAQAFFLRFINGGAEHQRAFLQYLGKRLPQEVNGQLDHTLTVKIVKQIGDREIVIDASDGPKFKRPPRDAATGERIPVATLPGEGPITDPVDG